MTANDIDSRSALRHVEWFFGTLTSKWLRCLL